MKIPSALAALGLAVFALPAFAQGASCDDETDTAATVACLDTYWQRETARTDLLMERLSALIAPQDESYVEDAPNGAARLAASAIAWEASRDADCALAGYAMAGGSWEAVITAACLGTQQASRNGWLEGRIAQFEMAE
ncbi:lysozyme inhibitor LprI family protein [Xinfangfangia sp. CPCC 101601]|uniref:Lysozyme inhibitor LprI family protein n=1 Tax=Pseudogemmobacter lacusdianii TaxID=3069608 RepID=A0ABU0VZK6_9RHOB|nr:lysozyme inhibitor LprI family protein [Xinfangfangia sp. CPCC 101601]MDQ2067197.1 lysozyme inhibitor LprI family protein [Xinfangfangia sp. CPCC 101601]